AAVEPRLVVEVPDVDNQRVTLPVAARVAREPLDVVGMRSLHKDSADGMDILVRDGDVCRRLKNLERIGHVRDTRHAWQITLRLRIRGDAVGEVLFLLSRG